MAPTQRRPRYYRHTVIHDDFEGLLDHHPIYRNLPELYHDFIDRYALERDIRFHGDFVDLDDGRVVQLSAGQTWSWFDAFDKYGFGDGDGPLGAGGLQLRL